MEILQTDIGKVYARVVGKTEDSRAVYAIPSVPYDLYHLQKGQQLKARIISNPSFHIPKEAKKVIFISCGTGIAPFLEMVDQNKNKELHIYAGFGHNNDKSKEYSAFFDEQKRKGKLREYHFIFSREQDEKRYVTDLLKRDAAFVKETLDTGGVIMICGMLSMYKDVAQWIDEPYSDRKSTRLTPVTVSSRMPSSA